MLVVGEVGGVCATCELDLCRRDRVSKRERDCCLPLPPLPLVLLLLVVVVVAVAVAFALLAPRCGLGLLSFRPRRLKDDRTRLVKERNESFGK